ncbi:Aldose 1-/Glucose-6-phosphate 1-epimerase [Penicillium herquei]|nr:Aldose 1-/Glucose-6-phosphate 1-epimerase [Penicillium herquei]
MERSNKPAAIGLGKSVPQPSVSIKENTVEASLPSGESVTIHLYGATVTSWKAHGQEQLFLSELSHLDGSKPIRGGIPLVFPYLGKSSAESADNQAGQAVKLDFGLSHTMLSEEFRAAWPYEFGLVYSVTLTETTLRTQLQVRNEGTQNFEFQVLMHTYLSVADISEIRVKNLESKTYVDKTRDATSHTEASPALAITEETDRIYQSLDPIIPIVVSSAADDTPLFSITREALTDVVVWNPWIEKAKGMADFGPDEAYKNMICVEAGSVSGWQTLEAGDSWEGGQTIKSRL